MVRLLDTDDWEWRRRGPSSQAVRAFGARADDLRRLPGGAGDAWTDGRLVLKPVGCIPEHAWVCEVYADWSCPDLRVPEPVLPHDTGIVGWSADGWGAHIFVPGRDADLPRELEPVKEASDAFHRCLEGVPRPAFMEHRDDPWAFGDRLAWEGADPVGDEATLDVIRQLQAHLAPVRSSSQVIHGDILPNVLLADGHPPAVIDWPPYFRPAAMANAITVTDVVTFRGAPLSLLARWAEGEVWFPPNRGGLPYAASGSRAAVALS